MNRFATRSRRISTAAMFLAFTLIFLYLACIMTSLRFVMYFIASLFIFGVMLEGEVGLAIIMFIGVCGLSLLMMPDKLRVLPYVLFFGHYGIGKYYIDKIKDKFLSAIIKLIYFNAAMVGMYFLCLPVLVADLPLETIPLWALAVALQVVFLGYDYCYSKAALLYQLKIKKWLTKQ